MSTSEIPPSDGSNQPELDEDESCWVPLEDQESWATSPIQPSANMEPAKASGTTVLASSTSALGASTSHPSKLHSVTELRERWEASRKLRTSFVDRPLDQSWGIFARHLFRELWLLDLHIRAGILLVLIGVLMQLALFASKWYQPRLLLVLVVFVVSFIYLAPPDVGRQLQAFLSLLSNPAHLMDHLDAAQLKRIFLASCLVPTVLEMRTFAFLSHVMVDAGWKASLFVALMLMALLLHRRMQQKLSPRDCISQGVRVLYGSALVAAMARADLSRLPALAGPFCLSTGTLLMFYRNDDRGWFTRSVRHALRLTLSDVLASVSQSVQQDEMLQLAMLRWIVDYWSSTPPCSGEPARPSDFVPPSSVRKKQDASVIHTQQAVAAGSSLPWEELSPMLDMTTDQMLEEVPSVRQSNVQTTPVIDASSSSGGHPVSQNNRSMLGLKSMLDSMDVDDRAKPAVMAYKRSVQNFPPSHSTAIWLSIIRRGPGTLVLAYRYVFDASLAFASTPILLAFVVMEVLRILQWSESCQRIQGQVTTTGDNAMTPVGISKLLANSDGVDPMCIFLSDDDLSLLRLPTLLQVWKNVQSSVTALEMGLTATRCAHTTVAAADFAGNVMSLAQLGLEVSQKGLGHGLGVLAKELISLHASNECTEDEQPRENTPELRYTNAAVGALRSGSIVARNVHALSEDKNAHPTIRSVAGAAMFLSGRGWLHGQNESPREREVDDGPHMEQKKILAPAAGVAPGGTVQSNVAIDNSATGDEYNEIIEAIALALEEELITEEEKNSFMESLVLSQNTVDRETSQSLRVGIRNSLDCLFQQSSEVESAGLTVDLPVEKQISDAAVETTTMDSVDHSHVSGQEQEDHSKSCALSLDLPHSQVSRDNSPIRFDAAPVPTPKTLDEPENEAENTSDVEVAAPEPTSTSAGNKTVHDREDDDIGKWVGGGLAVLGAVVGGIALANRPRRESRNRWSNDGYGEGQTITIEEIDEASDEWVTVQGIRGETDNSSS